MTGIRSTDRAPLIALGFAALAINGVALANLLLERSLGNPLSIALFGALLVGFVAQRLGVEETAMAARQWRQVLLAALLVVPVLALALALNWSPAARWVRPRLDVSVALAVVESFAVAYRDTLWLRILPSHAAEVARVPTIFLAAFVAAAGLAVASNQGDPSAAGYALTVAFAWLGMVLWLRSRNLWVPVVAHFTWIFTRDSVFSGLLFDLPRQNDPYGLQAAPVGWLIALLVALVAAFVWRRTPPLLMDASASEDACG